MSTTQRSSVWKPFFFAAAAFNAIVGLSLLATPANFYEMNGLPQPAQFLEARILGWMIIMFGAGYVLIAQRTITSASFIVLMALGKMGVVVLTVTYWLEGAVNTSGMLLGLGDLLWALGFIYLAMTASKSSANADQLGGNT